MTGKLSIRLKETHLPDELQPKAGAFSGFRRYILLIRQRKNQMYRQELLGLEAKVKEIAEQIEGLLKGMRELWSIKRREQGIRNSKTFLFFFCGHRIEKRICKL